MGWVAMAELEGASQIAAIPSESGISFKIRLPVKLETRTVLKNLYRGFWQGI